MGIGDWGLGIGDWDQSPFPNPPIPQSPFAHINNNLYNKKYLNFKQIKFNS